METKSVDRGRLAATALAVLLASPVLLADAPGPDVVAPGWTVEPVGSGFAPGYLDIEFDSQGAEHLVYGNSSTGQVEYRWRTPSGVWENGLFPYLGSLPAIDFDPADGQAYVLFRDSDPTVLKLAWRSGGGAWTSTTAVTSALVVRRLSFEMFGGTAHIAFSDENFALYYRHFDMDGFSYTVAIAEDDGPEAVECSLALRSDGLPRMTYNIGGVLYYGLTADTINWSAQVIDDSAANVGLHSSLALDADGAPHVSYRDETNQDLKYATKRYFNWLDEVVDGDMGAFGAWTSLALDPLSLRPRIAYYGGLQCPVCFSGQQADGTWSKTLVADTPSYWRKLIESANGEARIAYATYGAVDGVAVAFQDLKLFADGFESGGTGAWSAR